MPKSEARKKRKRQSEQNRLSSDNDLEGFTSRGVVFIRHLPHGFYEEALFGFFRQFGTVTRVKVVRNRQTLKPKGYAFVEFKYAAIAKVAAETMNNYIMFKKCLKCKLLKPNNVPNNLRMDDFKLPQKHKKAVKIFNSQKTEESVQKNRKKLFLRYLAKKKKLGEMGIDYELSDYEDAIARHKDTMGDLQAELENSKRQPLARRRNRNKAKKATKTDEKSTRKKPFKRVKSINKYLRPPKMMT